MTCIVAATYNGRTVLAGDSQGTDHSTQMNYKNRKVFRKRVPSRDGGVDMLIGHTCTFRLGDLLQHTWTPPAFQGDALFWLVTECIPSLIALFDAHKYDREKNGTVFLVAIDGRVFEIQTDLSVLEPELGYAACGSGEAVALGAMFNANSRSDNAYWICHGGLMAAGAHSPGVGGRLHFLELGVDGEAQP